LLDEVLRRGIVVVAAAPAELRAQTGFPASHAGVIAARSMSGNPIDGAPHALPAPGHDVLTTTPNAGYAFLSGNSLAAAHVSGVIALLLERAPALDAGRLALVLGESSDHPAPVRSISACRALLSLTGTARCRSGFSRESGIAAEDTPTDLAAEAAPTGLAAEAAPTARRPTAAESRTRR